MGKDVAVIKMKIMPTSPEVDLENLKSKIKESVEGMGGSNKEYSEQPIAFGLKAIIAVFRWDEEKELDDLEEKLKEIEEVQSVAVNEMSKVE